MLTYEKAIKSPKLFRAITGMTRPQFDLLYADVETKYDEAETARLSKRARERDIGAGRKFALSLQNRLLKKRCTQRPARPKIWRTWRH